MANKDGSGSIKLSPHIIQSLKSYCRTKNAYTKSVAEFLEISAMKELRRLKFDPNKENNNEQN